MEGMRRVAIYENQARVKWDGVGRRAFVRRLVPGLSTHVADENDDLGSNKELHDQEPPYKALRSPWERCFSATGSVADPDPFSCG